MKTNDGPEPFAELERGVHAALETYANVHRGSGHNSLVSTHLYEQARQIVLEHLELGKDKYAVIFCTPRRAESLTAQLRPGSYHSLSSRTSAWHWVSGPWQSTARRCPKAPPSGPVAGRPGSSPPAG